MLLLASRGAAVSQVSGVRWAVSTALDEGCASKIVIGTSNQAPEEPTLLLEAIRGMHDARPDKPVTVYTGVSFNTSDPMERDIARRLRDLAGPPAGPHAFATDYFARTYEGLAPASMSGLHEALALARASIEVVNEFDSHMQSTGFPAARSAAIAMTDVETTLVNLWGTESEADLFDRQDGASTALVMGMNYFDPARFDEASRAEGDLFESFRQSQAERGKVVMTVPTSCGLGAVVVAPSACGRRLQLLQRKTPESSLFPEQAADTASAVPLTDTADASGTGLQAAFLACGIGTMAAVSMGVGRSPEKRGASHGRGVVTRLSERDWRHGQPRAKPAASLRPMRALPETLATVGRAPTWSACPRGASEEVSSVLRGLNKEESGVQVKSLRTDMLRMVQQGGSGVACAAGMLHGVIESSLCKPYVLKGWLAQLGPELQIDVLSSSLLDAVEAPGTIGDALVEERMNHAFRLLESVRRNVAQALQFDGKEPAPVFKPQRGPHVESAHPEARKKSDADDAGRHEPMARVNVRAIRTAASRLPTHGQGVARGSDLWPFGDNHTPHVHIGSNFVTLKKDNNTQFRIVAGGWLRPKQLAAAQAYLQASPPSPRNRAMLDFLGSLAG